MLACMKYREEVFRQYARLWLQASNLVVSLQFQARCVPALAHKDGAGSTTIEFERCCPRAALTSAPSRSSRQLSHWRGLWRAAAGTAASRGVAGAVRGPRRRRCRRRASAQRTHPLLTPDLVCAG